MKKTVIILAIIITILSLNKQQKVIIPKKSIRFRVIANSNSRKDQLLKKKVVKSLEKDINKLETSSNIEETRQNIKENIPKISNTVENTLIDNNSKQKYSINYGKNYFPEKEYKGVVYKEGDYESVIIKLGEGLGDNFWCVLFPPLCLLDVEKEKTNDIEYSSYIKEVIDKYF